MKLGWHTFQWGLNLAQNRHEIYLFLLARRVKLVAYGRGFNLGYAYPRGYAKTSLGVRKIKKYICYFMINTE
jgi:hypothetical protein